MLRAREAGHGPHRVILSACLALLLAVAVACGGTTSADDSKPISENEAKAATNAFLKSTLGLFTGDTSGKAFIESFAPECREGVEPAALEFIVLFIRAFAPELGDMKIQEVDVGPIRIQQTQEGTLVIPENPEAMRVKVNGQFKPISEVFAGLGFEDVTGIEDDPEPILLVRRGGKIFLGDCEELQGFAD